MLGIHEVDIAVADAVLAGAGPLHRDRTEHHAVVVRDGPGDLVPVVRIDHVADVEVAVADMADYHALQSRGVEIGLALTDALGEAGERDADVGRPHLTAGTGGAGRVVGVVPGLPQPASVIRARRPSAVAVAALGGR